MRPVALRLVFFFSLCLWLVPSPVFAQDDPTRETSALFRGTSPVNPVAGQPYVLNVYSGDCEFLSDVRTGATVQSIVGNIVTIYIDGVPDLACSFTPGERQYDLPGIPAPGLYQFRVFFVPSIPDLESASIGTRSVTVVAQGQVSSGLFLVPTLKPFGLLALVLAALASARLWYRRN